MKNSALLTLLTLPLLAACSGMRTADSAANAGAGTSGRIRPWTENPRYWQYRGQPVLLLGGTKDDNLFQIPDLEAHLDELASVGGNFIRNTMSDREDKGYEVHAFKKLPDGRYDLDQWNEEYWRRFERMLELAEARGIIVQIEVWDRFDHSREHWLRDPFRPSNNINYTSEQTGLAEEYPNHPSRDEQPFFHTIPGMEGYEPRLELVRRYQERFVEKILSYTLERGNVLYCMDNETSTAPAWGRYWMEFIRKRAAGRGLEVYVTDMFDCGWKPEQCVALQEAIAMPETYLFIEISQVNSRNFGEDHWRRLRWVMERVEEHPRPVNHVKIYGAGATRWGSGTPKDGVERFWRNLIAGSAAARFHRDGSGTGLQPVSKAAIRAARQAESLIKFWDVTPHQELLRDREENEAYLAAAPGEAYLLYFTGGGEAGLDLSGAEGEFALRWISVAEGEWAGGATLEGGQVVRLAAPGPGGWVAAIRKR